MVDRNLDTWVGTGIGSWESNNRRWGATSSARDSNLNTSHIELGARVVSGGVEGNDLSSQEVVTVGNVCGDSDIPFTGLLCVQLVHSPDTTIKTLLLDLEPIKSVDVGLGTGIANLGEVDNDGSLVGGSDWVVTVGWTLLSVWKEVGLVSNCKRWKLAQYKTYWCDATQS